MVRLTDFLDRRNSVAALAAWIPLLALPVIWLGIGIWYHLNLFHVAAVPRPWLLWAAGSAGYLLTVAGLAVLGDKHRPMHAWSCIAVALAVGSALALIAYVLVSVYGPGLALSVSPVSSGGSDPMSPTNALAAVLAVVLAVVTIIATKSAADARAEAERARKEILDAIDVHMLARASQLLERALVARTVAEELEEDAENISQLDPVRGRFLRLVASCLRRTAKSLVLLHRWLLDRHVEGIDQLPGMLETLVLDLRLLENAPANVTSRLRNEFLRPIARLLDAIQGNINFSFVPIAEAEQVSSVLRKATKSFNEI